MQFPAKYVTQTEGRPPVSHTVPDAVMLNMTIGGCE